MIHRYTLRVGDRVIRISARSEQACFEAAEDICRYIRATTAAISVDPVV